MSNVDMITTCGHVIDYSDFEKTTIDMEDIRISTTNLRRYNGGLDVTLLQHLVLCYLIAKNLLGTGEHKDILTPVYAATHDFHEIYVTDVTGGLKKYLTEYNTIEKGAEEHVHNMIGLPLRYKNFEEVLWVDNRALVAEMSHHGHPGAAVCAERYGGPMTDVERVLIRSVYSKTNEELWEMLHGVVLQGQKDLAFLTSEESMYHDTLDLTGQE